jgi:hypothetical protein
MFIGSPVDGIGSYFSAASTTAVTPAAGRRRGKLNTLQTLVACGEPGYNHRCMRMSIWQFLGLVVVLVALYCAYHYWWVDQSRGRWVNGLHNRALNSDDEIKQDPGEKKTYTPDGWNR